MKQINLKVSQTNNAASILKTYATKALMLAETDFTFEVDGLVYNIPFGGLVAVTADSTADNNGVYRKISVAPLWEFVGRFGDNTLAAEAARDASIAKVGATVVDELGDSTADAASQNSVRLALLESSFAFTTRPFEKSKCFNINSSVGAGFSLDIPASIGYQYGNLYGTISNHTTTLTASDTFTKQILFHRTTKALSLVQYNAAFDSAVYVLAGYVSANIMRINGDYTRDGIFPFENGFQYPSILEYGGKFLTKPLDKTACFNINYPAGSGFSLDIPTALQFAYNGFLRTISNAGTTLTASTTAVRQLLFNKSTYALSLAAYNATVDTTTNILVGYVFRHKVYADADFTINGEFPFETLIVEEPIDLTSDTPSVTNTLAFLDTNDTPIYKDSLFKKMQSGRKYNVILETTKVDGSYKRIDIQNPTNIKASDVGSAARFIFEAYEQSGKLIYKQVDKILKNVSSGKAATLKLMTIGDSLTQGNLSVLVSPLALIMERFADYGTTVEGCGTFDQDNARGDAPGLYISEGRGYWNYKTFVGKASDAYGQAITISTGSGLTAKFENPFLREALSADLLAHPDWCFSNKVANPADDDGIPYSDFATNPQSKYYIFDFAYYLTQHSVETPDVITMALGINDWQETGTMNVDDEYLSAQIMYEQIRAALPTTPIMWIPNNGVMPSDQTEWEAEMFPLQERIITFLETEQLTDANLHICPIFEHVSRFNVFKTEADVENISTWNNVQIATISDVHALDKTTSQQEYMNAFENVLIGLY